MGRLRDGRILRALSAAAGTAAFIAIAIAVNGSISFHIATLHVRAHRVTTAAVAVLALSLLTIAVAERGALRMTLSWWWTALERKAHAAALILAVLALIIGINWGTWAAGGSDSYCYLNQAELFARGEVRDVEPLATDPSWPGSPAAFVPAGHSATPGVPGAFVPICPAGYPLLLAGARLLGGRYAMFIVTPVFGALAVWLAFVLGRRLAGPPAGALAAALALTSPIFLYQVVQPMNDVVATSLWMAALTLALRPGCRDSSRAVGAGLLCGAAVTVRPNLVPLAAVVALCAASSARRDDARGARG